MVVYNGENHFKYLASYVNYHPEIYHGPEKTSSNIMNPLNERFYDNFKPDYTACELFIRAVGYDIDNSTLIGHCLLRQRSSLKEKNKIWTEIQLKEYSNVWQECILKAQKRTTGRYTVPSKKKIKLESDTN